MAFDQVFQFPSELRGGRQGGRPRHVGIIGAGAAGLSAAYELERLGHRVAIFEDSNRPGGRIRTHRFADGTHSELGAMRIPANHGCTMHYVKEFQLPTRRFVNYNPRAYYHIRDVKTRIGDPSALYPAFKLLPDESADPLRPYEHLMKELMTSLSPEEQREIFSPNLTSEKLRKYASISFWQFLKERVSPEAFDLIGHATGMIQYERASLLEVFVDYFGLFRVDQYELSGGMETLIQAFVSRLRAPIHYNTRVTGIQKTEGGVAVHYSRLGHKRTETFDYVVCTVPAPALTRIEFEPALPPRQRQAISGITYASSAKTIVHTSARPWEYEDGIYGGGSFTDLPIQQCWYPSDNAKPVDRATYAAFTGDSDSPYSEAPLNWIAKDKERSHGPGVLTASYLWEANARRFLSLSEEDQTDVVIGQIRKLHPGLDRYVDEVIHWSWDRQNSPGSGAFAYFAPGEHERYQQLLSQPYPAEKPAVFFAGEHLAVAHAWIQGSIQTALHAVLQIKSLSAAGQQEVAI